MAVPRSLEEYLEYTINELISLRNLIKKEQIFIRPFIEHIFVTIETLTYISNLRANSKVKFINWVETYLDFSKLG